MEPPNKGHFGDDISSADSLFVERLSSLGGSKCILGIILGPQVVSFVERLIMQCPYLGESTIRGSTVLNLCKENSGQNSGHKENNENEHKMVCLRSLQHLFEEL